jgi:hypothetical protein
MKVVFATLVFVKLVYVNISGLCVVFLIIFQAAMP